MVQINKYLVESSLTSDKFASISIFKMYKYRSFSKRTITTNKSSIRISSQTETRKYFKCPQCHRKCFVPPDKTKKDIRFAITYCANCGCSFVVHKFFARFQNCYSYRFYDGSV